MPLISIIIPVYNVSGYIYRAFDSLLNQTIGFENLEVIFVDDASSDGSDEIIKNYSNEYGNVKSFFLERNSGGAGKPRNVGIENSNADYLMFLDPDDAFFENACEILYDEIIKEDIDIVSGVHSKDGVTAHPNLWFNTLTDPNDNHSNRLNKVNNLVSDDFELKIDSVDEYPSVISNFFIQSKIYKKKFFLENNINFPVGIVAEDSVFLFNSFLNASGIKFINKLICRYYDRDDDNLSLSNIFSKKSLMGRLDAYFKMYYLSIEKNKVEIFRKYLLRNKLNYFVGSHLLKCNLSVSDVLEILIHAKPLFKLYDDYNSSLNVKYRPLFKFIAYGDYENALKYINGEGSLEQEDIKVAVIMDEFSRNSFKYEFNLFDLHYNSWFDQFEKEKPHLFLCESAYHGVLTEKAPSGEWSGAISSNNETLKDILNYCNHNNIPTIFWNKEDPVSFNDKFNFTEIALNFDYIFTSSEECVPKYNELGHENVYPLMFASQPKLFNPIKIKKRLNDVVVFAGSWYKKFPKRCDVMGEIFDKIINTGLDLKIYDRFSKEGWDSMRYPEKYQKYVTGGVDYSLIPEVYKESEFGLNFNTVTNSNTMFARRVFELMASNTIVLSNYSKGVYRLFKDNVFYLDRNDLDLNKDLEKIKEGNLYNVLENHNYSNRFRQILDTINFKYIPELKHIVLFYQLDNLKNLTKIYNHFYSINYHYKHLKLVTGKENLFLQNAVLKENLSQIKLDENYYFSFTDLNQKPDFVKKALIHYSYIEPSVGIVENNELKYTFSNTDKFKNVIFNSMNFNKVLDNNGGFEVYNI